MNGNLRVRQIHRWVSMIFTVAVITVTILVLVQDQPAEWVYLSPLLPLALLLLTGLYLFALPYLSRRRAAERRAGL
jgi:heme A synthase